MTEAWGRLTSIAGVMVLFPIPAQDLSKLVCFEAFGWILLLSSLGFVSCGAESANGSCQSQHSSLSSTPTFESLINCHASRE